MNWELLDTQVIFRKGKGTRDQIANLHWIIEKVREFQENIYFCFIDYAIKPLTMWITTNCGKFLKGWEYQITLPVSWESCVQVKKQQLEPDMEQQTSSKLRKEYVKGIYCYPVHLIYMQNIWYEMPGWVNHKLKSKSLEEISTASAMQMIPL